MGFLNNRFFLFGMDTSWHNEIRPRKNHISPFSDQVDY